MKLSNYVFVLLPGAAFAVFFDAPAPTNPAVDGVLNLQGTTPKPTPAPLPRYLMNKRQGTASDSLLGYLAPDNTCGYVGGLLGELYRERTTSNVILMLVSQELSKRATHHNCAVL